MAGWAVVHQARQHLTHVVPVRDAVRHEVLVECRSSLRLRDGVTLTCLCGPSIHEDGNGTRVILHHALDGAFRSPPPRELP